MKSTGFAIGIFAIVAASAGRAQLAEPPQPPPEVSSPPAQAAPAPAPPAAASEEYVVRAGDTLASIAARLTGSEENWDEIARENGIDDPSALQVGQRLEIPAELKSI